MEDLTKRKTQIDEIIEAIENFNIPKLEVVLDANSYRILLDHLNILYKIYSKMEFIAFLKQNFEDLKKKHVKQLKGCITDYDPLFDTTIMFYGDFDFEPDFTSLGLKDMSLETHHYYSFMMDIKFDRHQKNITEIFLSDAP